MKNNLEALEVGPHRMRWICRTKMGECMGGEQVTEVVLESRRGGGHYRQQPNAHDQCGRKTKQHAQALRAIVASQRSALSSHAALSCG